MRVQIIRVGGPSSWMRSHHYEGRCVWFELSMEEVSYLPTIVTSPCKYKELDVPISGTSTITIPYEREKPLYIAVAYVPADKALIPDDSEYIYFLSIDESGRVTYLTIPELKKRVNANFRDRKSTKIMKAYRAAVDSVDSTDMVATTLATKLCNCYPFNVYHKASPSTNILEVSADSIFRAILCLPEHYRVIVEWIYDKKCEYKCIARLLELSVAAIKRAEKSALSEIVKSIETNNFDTVEYTPTAEELSKGDIEALYAANKMSTRLHNMLCRNTGAIYLSDLCQYTLLQIMEMWGMGAKIKEELLTLMSSYSLCLKPEDAKDKNDLHLCMPRCLFWFMQHNNITSLQQLSKVKRSEVEAYVQPWEDGGMEWVDTMFAHVGLKFAEEI